MAFLVGAIFALCFFFISPGLVEAAQGSYSVSPASQRTKHFQPTLADTIRIVRDEMPRAFLSFADMILSHLDWEFYEYSDCIKIWAVWEEVDADTVRLIVRCDEWRE